ncbi:trimethyllysine dioxygenase, mitochondrial isoform X2 [Neocloeon triangulifer]|uniref:trimethyllysine dioxygenase, mitochondrial isoform X2 n=1 Tax=Neocloeon triangulifer TaxID=2078957 RepID=UPI00286EC7CD|nr:trimethyllysine dioxygenase, mitochondrial isoform X2 [Neocloeon triangulifer]
MARLVKSTFLSALKNLKSQVRRSSSSYTVHKDYLQLVSAAGKKIEVDFLWLRDHCRCSQCYNAATSQRSLPFLSISENIRPLSCDISSDFTNLIISWPDGHTSRYALNWLCGLLEPNLRFKKLNKLFDLRKLWEDGKNPTLPRIDYVDLVEKKEEASLKEAVLSLLEYGIASINKVPSTVEATQLVVERIAPPQQTFFGGMWEFGTKIHNEVANHKDTAYTSDALDPHNDSTYFTESTGLQVFHCLERSKNCRGGATRLVDGMAAAEYLAQDDPNAFKILSEVAIESEYKEPGKHHVGRQPVIVLDPITQRVMQIRFNLYDRSAMCTLDSPKAFREYYLALRKLSNLMLSGRFEMQVELNKGNVIIIDNWRVLHGRTAFTGQRHMTGCYVARSEWLSRARLLGLI